MSRLYNNSASVLNVGSPTTVNDAEPFTFMCWGYPLSPTAATVSGNSAAALLGRLAAKDGGVVTGYWIFRLDTQDALNQIVFFKNYATTDIERRTSGSAFSTRQWNHFAVTWDGGATASNVHIYVNGVEPTYTATTNGVGLKQSDVSSTLLLGNRGSAIGAFNGTMAFFQLNSYVMSSDEIKQNMAIPGFSQQNLKGFWPCYGFNSPETDYSGNDNVATLTASTAGVLQPPISSVSNVPSKFCNAF